MKKKHSLAVTAGILAAGALAYALPGQAHHAFATEFDSSKPLVAWVMNSSFASPAWRISRAIVFESAMSLPTFNPSHTSAHSADVVRRGSTT